MGSASSVPRPRRTAAFLAWSFQWLAASLRLFTYSCSAELSFSKLYIITHWPGVSMTLVSAVVVISLWSPMFSHELVALVIGGHVRALLRIKSMFEDSPPFCQLVWPSSVGEQISMASRVMS